MNAFLIGPSLGYFDSNRKAFEEAAEALRGQGVYTLDPVNLREQGIDNGIVMLGIIQSEAVIALPGWEKDRIARLHAAVAGYLSLPLLSYPSLLTVQPNDIRLHE